MNDETEVAVEVNGEEVHRGPADEFDEAVEGAVDALEDDPDDRALEPGDLPEPLRELYPALKAATGSHNPIPEMPSDRKYPPADQVREIAEVLIADMPAHAHLREARIEYVYRGSLSRNGESVLGKMSKTGTKWRELGGFDFLMEINLEPYCFLSRAERIRLVDHELCHAAIDDESGDFVGRTHDIEEFVEIVDRWGTWHRKPAIRELIEKGQQRDLFETT